MSITSAMYSATSGLMAQSKALASISSNIANSSTTGFKSTGTNFNSYINKTSTIDEQTGGVLATTYRNISAQGEIQSSAVSTNMAINGEGFFVVSEETADGTVAFTRNGSFSTDAQGYLSNSEGYYLYGWALNANGAVTAGNKGSVGQPRPGQRRQHQGHAQGDLDHGHRRQPALGRGHRRQLHHRHGDVRQLGRQPLHHPELDQDRREHVGAGRLRPRHVLRRNPDHRDHRGVPHPALLQHRRHAGLRRHGGRGRHDDRRRPVRPVLHGRRLDHRGRRQRGRAEPRHRQQQQRPDPARVGRQHALGQRRDHDAERLQARLPDRHDHRQGRHRPRRLRQWRDAGDLPDPHRHLRQRRWAGKRHRHHLHPDGGGRSVPAPHGGRRQGRDGDGGRAGKLHGRADRRVQPHDRRPAGLFRRLQGHHDLAGHDGHADRHEALTVTAMHPPQPLLDGEAVLDGELRRLARRVDRHRSQPVPLPAERLALIDDLLGLRARIAAARAAVQAAIRQTGSAQRAATAYRRTGALRG
ncbi:exported protein of unknown function (plasmid) [Azospirillum baldaniorum]|uniref:Flagellar hook protein FlgE n=2 Tax=Azospirillum baldaniorum TaxID=1064539 RepID=A0A9P1JZP9_9PROT|nr:exported protein of unknown function [Azospirillum baldaniorum]